MTKSARHRRSRAADGYRFRTSGLRIPARGQGSAGWVSLARCRTPARSPARDRGWRRGVRRADGAVGTRYGFDRDELYFLDAARHSRRVSHVDQPAPALLAWVSLKLFGVSLIGLRVWPARSRRGDGGGCAGLPASSAAGGGRSCWRRSGRPRCRCCWGPVIWLTRHPTRCWRGRAWRSSSSGSGAPATAAGGRPGAWWPGPGVADDHSEALFAVAVVIGALLSGGRQLVFNRWFATTLAFETDAVAGPTGRPSP